MDTNDNRHGVIRISTATIPIQRADHELPNGPSTTGAEEVIETNFSALDEVVILSDVPTVMRMQERG